MEWLLGGGGSYEKSGGSTSRDGRDSTYDDQHQQGSQRAGSSKPPRPDSCPLPTADTVVHAYTDGPACLIYLPHPAEAEVQLANTLFEDRHTQEVTYLANATVNATGSQSTTSIDGSIEWSCLRLSAAHALVLGKQRTAVVPPTVPGDPAPGKQANGTTSRAQQWLERWEQLEVPGVSKKDMRNQIDLIRRTDWSRTTLGDMETWSPLFFSFCNQCLASPFPVMLNWGRDPVVFYNYPAALIAGNKHPQMMGQLYRIAWGELWDGLKPSVEAVFEKGQVLHQVNAKFFIQRNEFLEESAFTYTYVPCRDEDGKIAGFFNPFFETTAAVTAERRIRLLQEVSHAFTVSSSTQSFLQQVCDASERQAVDLPMLAFYDCSAHDDEQQLEDDINASVSAELRQGSDEDRDNRSGERQRRRSNDSDAGGRRTPEGDSESNTIALNFDKTYVRAAVCGVLPGSVVLPDSFPPEEGENKVHISPDGSSTSEISTTLLKAFWKVVRFQEPQVLRSKEIANLADGIRRTEHGDRINCIVIMPMLAMKDGLRAIAVIGLNPRRAYDHDYQVFLDLFKAQIAHGLTSIRLVTEEVRRARMFAAIVKSKNEELHQLLEARTVELRSSEMKFTKMADISPAGIWRLSSAGELTFVNDSWWSITGHPRDKPVDTFWESVHDDDVETVKYIFSTILERNLPSFEFRWKRRPGDTCDRWCTGSSRIETDDDGRVIAATGVLSDITDKKLIELNQKRQTEEATELRTAQERFIDMTSHELRNPLSAIVLSADSSVERLQDIVREGAAKDDAIAPGDPATGLAPRLRHEVQDTLEDLKIISHCCVHMTRLIDDVLTLSKLDNQFLIITPVPSRPTQFIRETLQIFKAEMQSKEIESELQTTSAFAELQVDYVLTDPSRMNQLLINLLTNAIKFTAPSKVRKIVVTLDVSETKPALATPATPSPDARDPGSESEAVNNEPVSDPTTVWLIVSVKDSGRGLTPEEVSGLFQRFKQANPRTHISYGGSGLGLFICRRIAEQLGGSINVSSERGQGSTFTFYIPAKRCSAPFSSSADPSQSPGFSQQQVGAAPAVRQLGTAVPATATDVLGALAGSEPAPSPDPLYVLVVEDNIVNQKLLQKHLSRIGCSVSVANHGQEAIDIIKRSRWATDDGPPISCVLMDIEMPVLDGMGAIRLLREMERQGKLRGHIPTLAVTANARQEQITAMEKAGFDGTISKPFKIPIIMDRIRTLLGSSR